MKKILMALCVCAMASCQEEPALVSQTATIISNVNLVDVEKGTILEDRYVVIDSGKIMAISQHMDQVEAYANRIDGNGKYLMPGLAEMHAHIPQPPTSEQRVEDVLFLYLSNGVTTIRGMLGHPSHLSLRERAAKGAVVSPRIFTSSPSLNGNTILTPEEAQAKVTAYQSDGYDFLKIHPGVPLAAFDQMATTAKEVGIEFAGHVPVAVGIRRALESQYASIDHIDGFLEGLVPESENVDPTENGFFGYNVTPLADTTRIDALVDMARENEVWIVPTQSLFTKWFAPANVDDLLALPEMRYMPQETLDNWRRVKEDYMADPNFSEGQWQEFDAIRKRLIKQLSDEGHGMLLGSDAPQLFNVPGFSIHREMRDMAEAGMSNLEIIRSGTINPARFFQMEDVFGTIKEGLEADLILLEANPLENLEALGQLSGVMRQGVWYPADSIAERLEAIAGRAAD